MAESFMFLEKTPKEMLQTFLVPLTTLLTLVYLEKGYQRLLPYCREETSKGGRAAAEVDGD